MADFFESPRFPDNISYSSSGGPTFRTFIFEGHSGVEQRLGTFTVAKHVYNVSFDTRDETDMATVRALFYNARGRLKGFRFKDWHDYSMTREDVGTGNGATTLFNITKKYVSGSETYTRRIYKPVSGSLTIEFLNGGVYTVIPQGGSSNQVLVDTTAGTLTFGASVIPTSSDHVLVTCEFDVPVRFDTDQMMPDHVAFDQASWNGIGLIELYLE